MILNCSFTVKVTKHMHATRRANENDRVPNVLTLPIGLLAFSYNIVGGIGLYDPPSFDKFNKFSPQT